jgi:hypothetical protein
MSPQNTFEIVDIEIWKQLNAELQACLSQCTGMGPLCYEICQTKYDPHYFPAAYLACMKACELAIAMCYTNRR